MNGTGLVPFKGVAQMKWEQSFRQLLESPTLMGGVNKSLQSPTLIYVGTVVVCLSLSPPRHPSIARMHSAEYMHTNRLTDTNPSAQCVPRGERERGGGALGYSVMPGCRVPAHGICLGHWLGCADLTQRGCVRR